jgi:predicted transcriptional regulator
MSELEEYKKELMKNPEFRTAYEKEHPEFEVIKAIITARCEQNLTQKDLAALTGLRQSNISRIETGTNSPNIRTLIEIAKGLKKELHIEFR